MALLGGGGVWTFLAARWPKSAADKIADSNAQLVGAVNAQTQAFIDEIVADRAELRGVVKRQAASIRRLGRRVLKLEGENELCRDEGREQQRKIDRLEAALRAADIDFPAEDLPGNLLTLVDGHRPELLRGPHRSSRKPEGSE